MSRTRQPSPGTLLFGPFEVNAPAGELRKRGVPVPLSGQPIRILAKLLAHPGEVVTREQLRAHVWGEATFVDFDHGLNAAVNKLRRALGDSAGTPRYIETVPGRGYRFVGTVTEAASPPPAAAESSSPVPAALAAPIPESQPAGKWHSPLAPWVMVVVVCIAAGWYFLRVPAPSAWKLTRLTVNPGLAASPALSPDGKLIAYSSDREAGGHFDIYVQQVPAAGRPIRLTFDGAGNTAPDFSPDGSRVVFRSSRDGGGIYEIAAFGGQARLLAPGGFDPRYSPDGSEVAYWVGAATIAQTVPGNGAIWVVPVAGGHPRRVAANLTSARQPIWSPDGRRLLVIGYASKALYDNSALDWWLVSARDASARPVRAGVLDALSRAQVVTRDAAGNLARTIPVALVPRPRCWLAAERTIVFSAEHGDTQSIWAATLSHGGRVTGDIQRLTAGADQEVDPSCAASGSIAFANPHRRAHIWWMPFETALGAATRPPERMTGGLAAEEYPSLSADARRVAYISDRSGLRSVWVRDLTSGQEARVAPSSFAQRYPVLSATGNRVAFSSYERDKRLVYAAPASGGTPELICRDCMRATDWSRDESAVLVFDGSPYSISKIDTATRRRTLLLQHASSPVLYGRFSPDNRWIGFTVRRPDNRSWLAIAPVQDATRPVGEEAWIRISEETPEDQANWGPDGNTLYFTSARDGHLCLWGQRLHPVNRQPMGEAFPAHHFHDPRVFQVGWSLAGERVAMTLLETTGNVWMMSPLGRR